LRFAHATPVHVQVLRASPGGLPPERSKCGARASDASEAPAGRRRRDVDHLRDAAEGRHVLGSGRGTTALNRTTDTRYSVSKFWRKISVVSIDQINFRKALVNGIMAKSYSGQMVFWPKILFQILH